MEMLQNADFWIGLMKIVWINIILSGDNAVVIFFTNHRRHLAPVHRRSIAQ